MNGYTVKRYKNGKLAICKILNIYNKDQEKLVLETLSNLVTGNITEEELLKEFSKKDVTR